MTVTGTIAYWVGYSVAATLISAAFLSGMFYLGRGIWRLVRRLTKR